MQHAKVSLDGLADPYFMMLPADDDQSVIVQGVRRDDAGKWRFSGKSREIPTAEFNDFCDFLEVQGNRVLMRDLNKARTFQVPLVAVARNGTNEEAYKAAAWTILTLLDAEESDGE